MLQLVLKTLRFRPAGPIFTALSVAIATALLTFSLAIQFHLAESLSYFDREHAMLVMSRDPDGLLPLKLEKQIMATPGVTALTRLLLLGRSSIGKVEFSLQGADEEYLKPEYFYVEPHALAKWRETKTGAIVGHQTAKDLGGVREGQNLTISTSTGQMSVTVVGISPKGILASAIVVHYEYGAEVTSHQGKATLFHIDVDPALNYHDVSAAIDEPYRNSDTPTRTVPMARMVAGVSRTMKLIPRLLGAAAIVILLVTFLVTANTIAISVRKRIPTFATLRAIGYGKGRIYALIVLESLLVCFVGGLLGSLIPYFAFREGFEIGKAMLGSVSIGLDTVGATCGIAVVIGLASSFVPAWLASRLSVVDALRS